MAKDVPGDVLRGSSRFEDTSWTQILRAQQTRTGHRRQAIGAIMAQYWRPVYFFLRRWGMDAEKARDVTQGFFCEIVWGRKLIQRATKAEGRKKRFRSFLLTALRNYLKDLHATEQASKRKPPGGVLSLEGEDIPDIPEPAGSCSPEQAYEFTWAATLLREAVEETVAGCRRDGLDKHWEVFHATEIQPKLFGGEAPPLRELCERLDIRSSATTKAAERASAMKVQVQRRFRAIIRRRVRRDVDGEQDVQAEIQEIAQILLRNRAGLAEVFRMAE